MPASAALLAAALVAAPPLDLPARVQPGELVLGRIAGEGAQHCRLAFGGRSLRVSADGRFVFGIERDAEGPVALEVTATPACPLPAGRHELAVAPRDFRIERVDGLPQQTVTPDPDVAARIAREQAAVAEARRRDDARSDFAAGFMRPLQGRVSGVYGSQRILNGTPRSPHYGLDVAAPTGTPVAAPADGIVSFAEQDLYLTGGTLLIDHGHGLTSSFLHLSRLDVERGQRVEAGQVIGAVGASGRASGPHLHWGFNWFDVRLDPALLPSREEASNAKDSE